MRPEEEQKQFLFNLMMSNRKCFVPPFWNKATQNTYRPNNYPRVVLQLENGLLHTAQTHKKKQQNTHTAKLHANLVSWNQVNSLSVGE